MSFSYVAFLLTILLLGTYDAHGFIRPKHDKVVVCYVASWATYRQGNGAFSLENLRPELCTHLIYAFAGLNASSWTIRSLDPWPDMEKDGIGNYRKMTMLRKQGLKVSLGIGGWNEGSANYSMMASSPDRRKIFIASAVEFLKTYGFDGLDLDWEFPGSRGGASYDKQNFVSLVKELKDAFRNYHFSLTAAISAVSSTINIAYDIPEISKYLDYIHIMAYDYHGAWNKQVLPNSPLRSKDQLDVEHTIKYLLQQGAPAEKLVLGLAMYGRTFVLTTEPKINKINPIGLTSLDIGFKGPYTSQEGFMGFNEICEALVLYPQDWTTGWDNESSTAYAIKRDHVVVYDDIKAMIAKVEYAKRQKLAGVMVWSIDTDDFRGKCTSLHSDMTLFDGGHYPLMKSINAALANNTIPPEENQLPDSSSIQLLSNIVFALSIATIYLSLFFSL
ncbi:probable chitinase 2 [Solenopsis invicta]|uniref:probable chitinase 2 n=1 Tax=Solenopsis invicta TaxID=13686 RepID=UPI000595AB50|nr:probable chitinase 2 [Solenopsis invicta]XP_039313932.1 probable chitinase 2 [Solenopsis invicta]